jgi:hypothetical protein
MARLMRPASNSCRDTLLCTTPLAHAPIHRDIAPHLSMPRHQPCLREFVFPAERATCMRMAMGWKASFSLSIGWARVCLLTEGVDIPSRKHTMSPVSAQTCSTDGHSWTTSPSRQTRYFGTTFRRSATMRGECLRAARQSARRGVPHLRPGRPAMLPARRPPKYLEPDTAVDCADRTARNRTRAPSARRPCSSGQSQGTRQASVR